MCSSISPVPRTSREADTEARGQYLITADIPQPKILIEGTHLTRKTDLAFALSEHVEIVGHRKRRWHIPLISAEWETRSDEQPTKASPGRSMIDYYPDDEKWVFEAYDNYVRTLELHREYYWIVDRFHISTVSHQLLHCGREVDLSWVDERLQRLGFVLVLLQRDPDTFVAAREHRLTYSENPDRYDDLGSFIREQGIMADLVAQSKLPSHIFDVSDGNVDRVAQEVLNWVREIGYFWRRK